MHVYIAASLIFEHDKFSRARYYVLAEVCFLSK